MAKGTAPLPFLLLQLLLYVFTSPSTCAQFPRDGAATSDDFPEWEISYYATAYLPTCGQSTEVEGSDYWSNCPLCDIPMSAFNASGSNLQVYDPSGMKSDSSQLGMGTQLCLCYTLLHLGDNVPLDICMLFGANGEILTEYQVLAGEVAVGMQQPNHRKTPLPQCKDVPVPSGSATASNAATAAQTADYYEPTSTGTSSSGSTGSSTNRQDDGGGGLSRDAVISLAVAIPGCIVAIITLWAMCCRRRHTTSHWPYQP